MRIAKLDKIRLPLGFNNFASDTGEFGTAIFDGLLLFVPERTEIKVVPVSDLERAGAKGVAEATEQEAGLRVEPAFRYEMDNVVIFLVNAPIYYPEFVYYGVSDEWKREPDRGIALDVATILFQNQKLDFVCVSDEDYAPFARTNELLGKNLLKRMYPDDPDVQKL